MARKVVQLNMKPVDPQLSQRILQEIDAQVVVADCDTEDEVIRVAHDADAIIRVGGPSHQEGHRIFGEMPNHKLLRHRYRWNRPSRGHGAGYLCLLRRGRKHRRGERPRHGHDVSFGP